MQETRATILEAIDEGPSTGPALAAELSVSRAAVWNHVEALREAGFEIASTADGYVLEGVPEYGAEAIEFGLEAPFSVEFHGSIGSTNDRARELATDGAEDVVVVADEQTGGRGRLDREWTAPPGGVWCSAVLGPDLPPAHAPLLTLAGAVATAGAVRSLDVDARIKWPNDVLVPLEDGATAKVAGLLTEMEGEADRVAWVVLGVGINANVDPGALPEEATSLRAIVGETVDRRELLQALLEALDELRRDPDAILPAWRELSDTLGRRVRVETPNGTVVGEAVDVAVPGALVVETDDGRRRIHAGDCEHLRPV